MTRPARNGVDVPSVFAVIDGVKGGNPGWWNDCGFRRSTCSRPGTGTAPSPAAPGPGHEDSHHAIGGLTRPQLTDCSTGPRRIRERQGPHPGPDNQGVYAGPRPQRGRIVNRNWDVVVVGARMAGAATARLLLARGGLRVLCVDRSRYGSDTLSTHALMRGGSLQLQRWGRLPCDPAPPGIHRSHP